VVVIGRGTVLADQSVADFVDRSASSQVLVRVADTAAVLSAATRAGLAAVSEGPDGVVVTGASTEQVGLLVHETGQPVRELVARNASLEQAFIDLTRDAQEYTGGEVA